MSRKIFRTRILIAGLSVMLLIAGALPSFAGPVKARDKATKVRVYPQPASGQVTLEITAEVPGIYRYDICSLNGDVVMQIVIPISHPGTFIQALELGGLPKGPYLLFDHDGSRRDSSSTIIVGP